MQTWNGTTRRPATIQTCSPYSPRMDDTIGSCGGSIMDTIFTVVVNQLVTVTLSGTLDLVWGIQTLYNSPYFEAQVSRKPKSSRGSAEAPKPSVSSTKTVATLLLEHEAPNQYKRAFISPKRIGRRCTITNVWLEVANHIGIFICTFVTVGCTHRWSKTATLERSFSSLFEHDRGNMFSHALEVKRALMAASRIFRMLGISKSGASSGPSSKRDENDIAASTDSDPPRPRSRASGGVSIVFENAILAYLTRYSRAPDRRQHEFHDPMRAIVWTRLVFADGNVHPWPAHPPAASKSTTLVTPSR